jgi:hypothetical protein
VHLAEIRVMKTATLSGVLRVTFCNGVSAHDEDICEEEMWMKISIDRKETDLRTQRKKKLRGLSPRVN